MSYYDELGIDRTATKAQIKQRYHILALSLHPDTPGGSEAAFLRLSEAYACLINPLSRRAYDTSIAAAAPVVTPPMARPSATSPQPAARRSYFGRFVVVMALLLVGLSGRAIYLLTREPAVPSPRAVAPAANNPGISNVVPSTTSDDTSADQTPPDTASSRADQSPRDRSVQSGIDGTPQYQGNGRFGRVDRLSGSDDAPT